MRKEVFTVRRERVNNPTFQLSELLVSFKSGSYTRKLPNYFRE